MHLNTWNEFRHGVYSCFLQGKDALFNLLDALLSECEAQLSRPILNWPPWVNELQRTTFHERRWTSRRWHPEPLQTRLRVPHDQLGAPSSDNCGHLLG